MAWKQLLIRSSGELQRLLLSSMRDRSGHTAVEYGLLVGALSVGIMVGVIAAGAELSSVFVDAQVALSNSQD